MKTFVIVSQVFVPDPASVGQHMADAAAALARRGHRVIVLTSRSGYEDASARYPSRERMDGVDVIRLGWSSFGKTSVTRRLAANVLFLMQVVVRTVFMRDLDTLVVSTSPPLSIAAALVVGLRRVKVKLWLMDLNPDQAVALGIVRPRSISARIFDWLMRRALARSDDVIVLDRFMAARVLRKLDVSAKLTVLPPWAHENHLTPVAHSENPFRREHALNGTRVIMYSGNHSPSNPLSTLVEAAKRIEGDASPVIMFVGGGSGKAEVETADASNIRSLPYQPLNKLRYSLSAADVHVVSIGDSVVGIVHPCKVYGAMAVARPLLLFGPRESHVGDLLEKYDIGWHVPHGDIDRAEQILRYIVVADPQELAEKGARARAVLEEHLSQARLCGDLVSVLER